MRAPRTPFAVLALLALALPFGLGAEEVPPEEPSLAAAITGGELHLGLRYRFEEVSDDRFDKDAHASTLRTVLGYTTKRWRRLRLAVEVENVSEIGTADQFDNRGAGSLANGVDDRPVVADPELTEVQQVYLGVEVPGGELRLGRLEGGLDDLRFIGPVGWRQNHQSYDGAALDTDFGADRLKLSYIYLDRVHRIFGDDQPMASHAAELSLISRLGEFGAFVYRLDYERPADAVLSTSTLGLRWSGRRQVGALALSGRLRFARQRDTGDNPLSVDADYRFAEIGAERGEWSASAAHEVLGGDPRDGRFTTPLATLHAFNGWADRFLATPANGLRDSWIAVGWTSRPWRAELILHRFEADSGGERYGDELDALVAYRTSWGPGFLLKATRFAADSLEGDTTKLWFQAAWNF